MDPHPSPLDPAEPQLSIEPVIGWRVWSIRAAASGEVTLVSPMQDFRWRPMEPSRAVCRAAARGHRVPDRTCTCGFYAAAWPHRLPSAALPIALHGCAVVGSVTLWGTVVEHAAGYRATFGYPDRIRLVCGPCFRIGGDAVPTRVFLSGGGYLIPLCSTHMPSTDALPSAMSPVDLERALLSRYAIDLLPLEALHQAGFHPESPRPAGSGLLEEAKAEWHELVHSWAGRVGALVLVLVFLWLGKAEFLVSLPVPVITPSPPRVSPLVGSGDPPRALLPESAEGSARVGAQRSSLSLTFLCGRVRDEEARLVECGRAVGALAGFVSAPPQPRKACDTGNAYTRKEAFSVCWLDVTRLDERTGPPLVVLELPAVHWRDLLSDEPW